MAVPIPPTTTTITPVISVAFPIGIGGTGITYSQFIQSLGKYNYGAEFFYLSSNTYTQVGQPIFYNHFDANGNSVSTFLPFAVDPYQSQPSIFYETESDQIVLTGLTSMQFTIYSGNTVYFKFFATITYLGNELDNEGKNAFTELEKEEGIKFFDDFCNYLIDEQ